MAKVPLLAVCSGVLMLCGLFFWYDKKTQPLPVSTQALVYQGKDGNFRVMLLPPDSDWMEERDRLLIHSPDAFWTAERVRLATIDKSERHNSQ